jgi:hypothetical protein
MSARFEPGVEMRRAKPEAPGTNRPETRPFDRRAPAGEEISTAVDEAVEYFRKGLETA